MTPDTIPQTVLFPDLFAKPLVATFDRVQASSDGGAVLLKAACDSAPATEQAHTPEDVQERPARRFGSLVPLSAGHAYASLTDARSAFGDTGGGGDGTP